MSRLHKRKNIAFVGNSMSREKAPYDEPEWEVHGCNEMEYPGKIDAMWELHPFSVQNERELEFLKKYDKPVFVLDKAEAILYGVKKPTEYPLGKIEKQVWYEPFFCCTMSYQIAYAIYEGYQGIGLWGFGMDAGSPRERTIEAASMLYWMGIAKGIGIRFVWNDSPIKNRLFYGYDYWDEIAVVDAWLYKLAIHTIFRLGYRHISVGGDDEPIRRSKNLLSSNYTKKKVYR